MALKNSATTATTEKDGEKTIQNKKNMYSGKESLKEIFKELLQTTYSAENQLIEALPKMAQAADNEDLSEAFKNHLTQTKKQASRLEKVFDRLGFEKKDKKCEAMEGLIKEGQQIIEEHNEGITRDVALIIAAQKVEHYEIAAYGSLVELADVLRLDKIADTLEETLEEEKETDELLSAIAQDVNDDAYEYSSEELKYNS
jgi:ferritin-like metal-binding protein YciE